MSTSQHAFQAGKKPHMVDGIVYNQLSDLLSFCFAYLLGKEYFFYHS